MNKRVLYAFGAVALTMSMVVGCGGGSSSSGSGGSTATGGATGSGGTTGAGGSKGSGGSGAGGKAATVAQACSNYCAVNADSCPNCAALPPVISACIKFCLAEADCSMGGDVTHSIDYRCIKNVNGVDSLDTLPAACKTAYTDWYNCLAGQSQVCVDGKANTPGSCTAQADALGAACN
jgi:hypothetical protein